MLQINVLRAETLLREVYDAYKRKGKLFAAVNREADAVQHKWIPKGMQKGSREHIVWLFFATLTDRRQVSELVYQAHCELFNQHPYLYKKEMWELVNEKELIDILLRYRVGLPRQSSGYWIRCAQTLFNELEGDPTHLYQGGSIESALLWKDGYRKRHKVDPLPGYGPKIMSLYGLYLAEVGLVQLFDAFPVDVHVQRWFLSTNCFEGVSDGNIVNESLEELIRPFITTFCIENNISWIDLSHALWFLGNRLCSGCPKNKMVPLLCPSHESCGGAWNSRSYFLRGYWDPNTRRFRRGGDTSFCMSFGQGTLFEGMDA